MRERQLYEAVNRRIPKTVHHQGMTGASMVCNGTPDRYYDGVVRDLWVEYKMLRSLPRSGVAVGDYTPLQLRWMTRRWERGKNVIGVVGLPGRVACIQLSPDEWKLGTEVASALSLDQVAQWIVDYCGD